MVPVSLGQDFVSCYQTLCKCNLEAGVRDGDVLLKGPVDKPALEERLAVGPVRPDVKGAGSDAENEGLDPVAEAVAQTRPDQTRPDQTGEGQAGHLGHEAEPPGDQEVSGRLAASISLDP